MCWPIKFLHKQLIYSYATSLLETQSHIFLLEVKSGLFSNASKRGAIKSLKSNIRDTIGYAFEQLTRTENYIKTNPSPSFYNEREAIIIDSTKTIIKIAVPFASIIGITNQLYELGQAGILASQQDFPLSVSIFDLMVISEIFENDEKGFTEYVKARILLYQEEGFKIDNELDFLGLYLSRDYRKAMKVYRREKVFTVNTEYKSKISNYFDAKFLGITYKMPKKIEG